MIPWPGWYSGGRCVREGRRPGDLLRGVAQLLLQAGRWGGAGRCSAVLCANPAIACQGSRIVETFEEQLIFHTLLKASPCEHSVLRLAMNKASAICSPPDTREFVIPCTQQSHHCVLFSRFYTLRRIRLETALHSAFPLPRTHPFSTPRHASHASSLPLPPHR